jgi:hypothetical protein
LNLRSESTLGTDIELSQIEICFNHHYPHPLHFGVSVMNGIQTRRHINILGLAARHISDLPGNSLLVSRVPVLTARVSRTAIFKVEKVRSIFGVYHDCMVANGRTISASDRATKLGESTGIQVQFR